MTVTSTSPTPWWRPLQKSDRTALLWLVVIPIALFVIPALLGRPAIDADNLIQNFPLRVLAGHQIASGHLPLLDPLTNAGTPLLGGMNAGALYPLTVIFAFIPAIAAWVFNVIVVYVTASLGVFALLRWHGLRTLPSFAAAITYAYSGAMIGQMVHLGVIQGFSFIPWAAVLMLALSKKMSRMSSDATLLELARAAFPWIVGVGLLWGLVFLSGEPRGIAEIELLTIIMVPSVLLLRSSNWIATWRLRWAYLATLIVGFVWGLGLGLIQLLPGWSFITFSQRSDVNYRFFGAGSLAVRWSVLLLTPDLFGGNGALGQPGFFANYNLAEVTGYVGVLALMGAAAFATRLTRRGWKGPDRDFMMYVIVGVIGLFAAWGYFTPLGHIFRVIPLFGSTRLQSRNIILVDFALAMMLGWWFERVLETREDRAKIRTSSLWITALPAIVVVGLSAALLAWGPYVIKHIGVPAGKSYLSDAIKLVNVLHLVIALAAVLAVLAWRHSRKIMTALMAILVADLLVFSAFTATGIIGGSGPREPSRSNAASLFGVKGRFALVDLAGGHTGVYRSLGEPNLNVFTGLASVQGYGALISTIYDDATGTHPQTMLNPCHLADGTFKQLRLKSLAVSATALSQSTSFAPTAPQSCVTTKSAPTTRRYFGQLLDVSSIYVAGVDGHYLSTSQFSVRLLNSSGKVFGPDETPVYGQSSSVPGFKGAGFKLFQPIEAAGFVVSSPTGVNVGDALVTDSSGKKYRLDTPFQLALSTSAWKLTATDGSFSVFKATTLLPKAWLKRGYSQGNVTKIRSASWGDTWVSLNVTTTSVLERSEAYLPGWRATALNVTTGQSVNLDVYRSGLIEAVQVPKGTWVIHFHYHAPYIEVSSAASLISWVLLLGVAVTFTVKKRRRRTAKVST